MPPAQTIQFAGEDKFSSTVSSCRAKIFGTYNHHVLIDSVSVTRRAHRSARGALSGLEDSAHSIADHSDLPEPWGGGPEKAKIDPFPTETTRDRQP